MRTLVLLALCCGACLEEDGPPPDGVAGTWKAGKETLKFEASDLTMTWSDGERSLRGTWRIDPPDGLTLTCGLCPFQADSHWFRVGEHRLLMDGLLVGSPTAEPGSSWSESRFVEDHVRCSGMAMVSRTVTLSATDAMEHTVSCCAPNTFCTETMLAGPWEATDDGFTFVADGVQHERFLLDSALSSRQWIRK